MQKLFKNLLRNYKTRAVLVISITSFLISLLLLVGRTDPDFHAYYTIGRGVIRGYDMFADFAVNKGPVTYVVFAGLYAVFRDNYNLALIIASSVSDALTVAIMLAVIKEWFGLKIYSTKVSHYIWLVFITALYKSYLIGSVHGGFLSESITYPLALASLYLYKKERLALAATLISLSFCGRLTTLFFLIIPLAYNVFIVRDLIKLFRFVSYIILSSLVIIGIASLFGDLRYLFLNTITRNISFISTFQDVLLYKIVATMILQPHLLMSFLVIFAISIHFLISKSSRNKLLYIVFGLASTLATFVTGSFFYHQFAQFSLVVFASLYLVKDQHRKNLCMILLSIFVIFNYLMFTANKLDNTSLQSFLIKEVDLHGQDYLQMVTYQPEYYLLTDKDPMDRYFQPLFLTTLTERNASIYQDQHRLVTPERTADTTFVFVYENEFDRLVGKEYLNNFKNKFKLEKVSEYRDGKDNVLAEIYLSL